MRTLSLAIAGSLLALSPAAHAEDQVSSPIGDAPMADVHGWMVSELPDRPFATARQVLADTGVSELGGAAPLILYLNRAGTTLSPANANDSRTNRSTIVTQTTAIPAWNVSAATWASVVSCVEQMWAPFNVQVTDVDPGNVPHMESIVTTRSSVVGLGPNIGGVSPYTIGCNVIPNSIVFTFAELLGNNPETVCEVMGQEMAHSIGLDHELLASDPMTYLPYSGLQSFKDQTASCGEDVARLCGLEGECGNGQNSYQMLATRVGLAQPPGGENGVPTVAITSPPDGAAVPPTFTVVADAGDDGTVARVELLIDGALSDTRTSAPFQFAVALGEGTHTLETVAYDDAGASSSASIAVTVSADAPAVEPPAGAGDGTGGGDGDGDGSGTPPADLVGGCSAGGGAGVGAMLALLGLVGRRRRRRHVR